MRRKSFEDAPCGIAQTLETFGDAWSFLIMREALLGVTSFDGFVEALAIPRNTLTARLETFVAHGVMSKKTEEADRRRSVYLLEEAGRDLWVVMLALQQWGNKWRFADKGAPSFMAERKSKRPVDALKVTTGRGRALALEDITMIPGPSATPALKKRFERLP